MEVHGIEWKKCIGVSSNEACTMTRKHSQIVTQIKVIASDAKSVHCSNHQEAVAATKLLAILKTVLSEAVKRRNFN
jgi:hypothetical protein